MRIVDKLRSLVTAAIVVAMAVLGGWWTSASAFAAGDVNEPSCPAATETSAGFRAPLPDCRAYEIVSQANSGDTTNVVGSYGFPEGAHVYYKSFLPTPGEGVRDGLPERFLATRTPSGWTQMAISAPQGKGPVHVSLAEQENAEGVSFTGDFSEAFLKSPFRDPFEVPQLNETTGMGAYRFTIDGGAVALLSVPDSGELTQEMIEVPKADAALAEVNGWGAFLVGGSADGTKAFFVTTSRLATALGTPQDTHSSSNEIYERTGGHTYLVGVLPDGSVPACGAEAGQGVSSTLSTQVFYSYGAVAPSGANVVFFTPGPQAGNGCETHGLFLRDVVHETTVQLPGTLYGGRAGTRPGEEEKIFTFNAEAGGIYEYRVGTGQSTEIGVGDLLAYSPDGSRVYFLGPEEGIYVYEEGMPARMVPGTGAGGYMAGGIGGGLIENHEQSDYGKTRNMPVTTPDGSHLLFIDSAQLTEYNNEGHFEAYVYDAEDESVSCISCSPRSEPPVGKAGEPGEGRAQLIDEFSTDVGEQPYQTPSPPFISNDGSRAVFETTEALVPQDVNGTMDVYEWERAGTGGCRAESLRVENIAESPAYSAVDGGCVYMLSSGLGKEVLNENNIVDGTHLVGASENLQDVYIQTSESLLPGLDSASKLYDVRVDGGFPYTISSRGCEPAECRARTGEPPSFGVPATLKVGGPGNLGSSTGKSKLRAHRLARKRKLVRALKVCRRHKGKRRRLACERAARKRYGGAGDRGRRSGGSR